MRTFIDQTNEASRRGQAIARLYGYMVRRDVDPLVALSIAYMADETRNKPPLGPAEVSRICKVIADREDRRRESLR